MGNVNETKRRLIEAATAEFAAHGIAGARVDRIAAMSGCNKQAIYAYYGNKIGLFDAVYTAMVVDTADNVAFDAQDLPGYAVQLFDRYRQHPEVQKLAAWQQFERDDKTDPAPVVIARKRKVDAIRRGQRNGVICDDLAPQHLLALILRMATVGVYGSPEAGRAREPSEAMRAALFHAVRKLVTP